MYSLVVLMALGTAGEAPDYWGGCGYGGYGGGYCGGWGGGYCGGYGGGYCGGYSSYCGGYSSYCGGYSSYCGGYSSYCGGYGGGYSCYSPCYSYTPCYSYSAPAYCAPMQISPAAPMPRKDGKKPEEEVSATIIVNLPADAKLTFDGEATKSTSARRTFVTPELKPGVEYSYILKAERMQDGKPVVLADKKVTFKVGDKIEINLNQAPATVASR